MSELPEPVWQQPVRRPTPAALPTRVDICVVGGGITGVLAMRGLRDRGIGALLVERAGLAAGASGRNAGFLLSGVATSYAVAVDRHSRSVARDAWACSVEGHELLRSALGEAGARVAGLRRRGAWTLALDDDEAVDLRRSEVLLAEDSLAGRFVAEPPEAPVDCRGGLLVEGDGEVDPAAAVAALAALLPDACVAEGVSVLGLEASRGAGDVRLHTSRGELGCGAVVLATNAWTSELVEDIGIAPVRAQMLATAPLPPRLSRRPVYAGRGQRYWRQLDDGRLLVGGCRELAVEEETGTEAVTTTVVQAGLEAQLDRLNAGNANVERRWAGIMGFSDDGLPLVGEVPAGSGISVCGGYTGHGMSFAAACVGLLLGALCDGQRAAIPGWLRADRHQATPRGPAR